MQNVPTMFSRWWYNEILFRKSFIFCLFSRTALETNRTCPYDDQDYGRQHECAKHESANDQTNFMFLNTLGIVSSAMVAVYETSHENPGRQQTE